MDEVPDEAFFARDAVEVAKDLIGTELQVAGVGGILVETEAYRGDDPASHSHGGPTKRNRSMFEAPATAYVYRSYGIHWCLNVVCLRGSAVLLRALEPRFGMDRMRARRQVEMPARLCAGPGRLGQALGVDGSFDGLSFLRPPFQLRLPPHRPEWICGPRIGISRATKLPWRFGLAGSPFLSKPFPRE